MGDFRAQLRRAWRVVPLVVITACFPGSAYCGALGLCNHDERFTFTIVSPDDGAAYEAELVPIRLAFDDNEDDDASVEAWVGGAGPFGSVRVPMSGGEALLEVDLASYDTQTITISVSSAYEIEDVTVAWTPAWELDTIVVEGRGPLVADMTLDGRERVTATVRRDATRLDRLEVRADGEVLGATDAAPWQVDFDLDALPDGAHTLSVVAVRDDGRETSVVAAVTIANCPRALAQIRGFVDFGPDGVRVVPGAVLDLTTDEVRELPGDGPVLYDDAARVAYGTTNQDLYALDLDAPGAATRVGDMWQPTAIAQASDGTIYFTSVDHHVYRVVGATYAQVTTTPIAGTLGGLLVDADDTLLVSDGSAVWRVTVVAGVETARVQVALHAGASALARDDDGRFYVGGTELGRFPAGFAGGPDVVGPNAGNGTNMSFLQYPPACYGLVVPTSDQPLVIDVGSVRGVP